MLNYIKINNRRIGSGYPVYVIAEMSANHNKDINQAIEIVKAARDAGADAVKLQTYTPYTLTINCKNKYFRISKGTIWEGKYLYDLYEEAYTPWDWHPILKKVANDVGIDLFSTPFDKTAVDYLEEMNVPAYKVASFENVDLPLLRNIAYTGKPIIMSTGMASLSELDEAVNTISNAGGNQLSFLKCTSAYPASPEEMNLRTISHMSEYFNIPVGLSDHTVGITVPIAAIAIGACIIEKHFTLSRNIKGPDSAFSMEPKELKKLITAIRDTEHSLGIVKYGPSKSELPSCIFRRSLFVVDDMKEGQVFSKENVRSIRPGFGMHTRHFEEIIGKSAAKDIKRGTPLTEDLIFPDKLPSGK